jgi:tyrosine-specific transport protein
MKAKTGNAFGGSLIIAGTGIGAGMLGMPVSTGAGGLFASIIFYVICWAVMICTGLIFVEIDLWLKDEKSNFLTIANHLLGKSAKRIVAIIYVILFYSLLVAYVSGVGSIFSFLLPYTLTTILFVALLAPLILKGAYFIDRVNFIFMLGLFASYALFIFFGLPFVKMERFKVFNLADSLPGLPVIFTAFSFQGTIPSLVNYLKRDTKKVRQSIFWGTTIALLIYLIWQALILGIVPLTGPGSLAEAKALGQTAVYSLHQLTNNTWIYVLGQSFAICAITTSFLGINMGLVDFLADGLKLEKKGKGLALIGLLAFLPPLIFALSNPKIFLSALHFAGGVGCVLLLGVFPICALYVGRYIRKLSSMQAFPFGKFTLFLLLVFLLFVFFVELKQLFI